MPTNAPTYLPRDPRQDPRTRKFMQLLGKVINALIADGVLTRSGGSFVITVPADVARVDVANTFTQNNIFHGQTQIDSLFGPLHTDTDGATVTFDAGLANLHQVTIAANRILAVTGDQIGEQFDIIITQGAGGSHLVTWFAGILWPGGVVPTLTLTAGKRDWFRFLKVAGGTYLGITMGLNF